jgi:hypothetical protein
MKNGTLLASLLASLLATSPGFSQQTPDAEVANEYCDTLIEKWDLLFEWARAATPDPEKGIAALDEYANKGRPLVERSLYPYEQKLLERAYLQAVLVAVQLAIYPDKEAANLTEELKEGARAQCFSGLLGSLSEIPLPPKL